MSLEHKLLDTWYGGNRSGWWLAPLGALFHAVSATRSALYRRGVLASKHPTAPVVVVGNITAGGTGKTPLVIWLAEQFAAAGVRAGVLLRGYGGKSSRWPLQVEANTDPALAGDEAVLIARRTGAMVVAAPDRAAGAAQLAAAGVDVIVCDDGLQHYRLARDCEIVVVDASRGFGNGRFIPAGPLRESTDRLGTVDAVVVNGAGGDWPDCLRMHVVGDSVVSIGDGNSRPLAEFSGQRVHAVAGIGNPARFFALLEAAGLKPVRHEFADHAVYRHSDFDFGDELPVVMTEKDAVKCSDFATAGMYFLKVDAVLDDAAELRRRVSAATGLQLG